MFELNFTTKKTGSGVGLAIAKNAVEMHGGTLRFKRTGDQRNRFTIRLPLSP